MRNRLAALAGISAVLLLAGGVAYAAVTVSFSATMAPKKAGKPTGLFVKVLSASPGELQPPVMERLVIKLDGGAKFNPTKFKRCKLTTLQARGPRECPKASKIGTGTGIGLARPVVNDPVNAKLTVFNGDRQGGKNTILVYVFPDLGPTFVSVGKISKSGGKWNLDFSIPAIKTLPSAPDASVSYIKTKTPIKRVTKKRHGKKRKYYLIVAPKKCKGSWKGSGTFYFRTGEVLKVPLKQKCKK